MEFNALTWLFTIFIIIVIILRISSCIDNYDEDDEIIIEDRTPELSDSESEWQNVNVGYFTSLGHIKTLASLRASFSK